MKKRTIARYGKYRIRVEDGFVDHREMLILLTIGAIAAIILTAKWVGFDVIESWFAWIRLR